MLAIRMQRTGRKGHAMFRILVQDSRRTPSSGKYVALLGSYDPHSKSTTLAKDKVSFYLDHGAQPSDRVVSLLKSEGVKLPSWISIEAKKPGTVRHPEKLRRNRPPEEAKSEDKTAPPEVSEPEEAVSKEIETEEVKSEIPPEKNHEPEVTTETEKAPMDEAASNEPEKNSDLSKAK